MRPGTILILNGASSSGKTSLLKALQARLPEPYLNAGIDTFIWMLPERYLERPLWNDVLGLAVAPGAAGRVLFSGMHRAIAGLARAGNNVVADHVLVEPGWVVECARLFHGLPAYLIGVYCPLEALEAREQARRDRTLGQAKAQFPLVHAHGVYDLTVNTALHTPHECADLTLARLAEGPPCAFEQIRQITS